MKKMALAAIVIAALIVGSASYFILAKPKITQPIKFNHKHHVKEVGLECSTCHIYYETERFSGLPTLDICMGCHEEKVTDKAEEEKIRATAKAGSELHWNRIYNVPDHVYYSHQ